MRTLSVRLAVCAPAIIAAALFGAKVVHASPGLPLVAADSASADSTRPASPPSPVMPPPAPATDSTRQLGVADTVTALPPVRVDADRSQHSDRSSATTVRLDRANIARFQPATVSDALLAAPGVDVSRTGPWASNVSMRGLSGERVLVLVDGVRLQTGRGHGAQTSLVSVDKLESVELLPGAGGAVYGSDALGGVVELNTHHNLLAQRTATFMLTARSATPGEENSAMGRLRYTSPGFGAEVAAGAGGLSALVTPDGRVPHSSYHEYDVSGRMSATLGASMLDFEHSQHEARDILLPAFTDGAGSHAEFPLQGRDVNRLEWQMPAAGRRPEMRVLGVNQRFRTNFVETVADSQFFRGRYVALKTSRADDRITTTSNGVQPSITYGGLRMNGEYRHESTHGPRYTDVVVTNVAGAQTSAAREPGESMPPATRDVLAGAAFYGVTWKHLRLESGLRYDWLHSRADSTPQSFTPELNVTDERWSAEGGLSRAFGAVTPYGRVATGFRAPNLEERYFNDDIHGGLRLFGNPDLLPERTGTVEVGVRTGETAGGHLIATRVSAYRSRVDELISLKYLGQLYLIPRFQYTNIHKAVLDGIEMQVDGALGILRASANAAFPRGRDLETGATIPDIGAARATIDLRVPVARVLPNGGLALRVRWTDASAKGDANLARAAFWTAATELSCVAWGTRVALAVKNITNTRYYEPLSFIPEPGRTVLLSMRREMALPWPRANSNPGSSSMTCHLSPRRCTNATLVAMLLVLASGSASARSGANPEGRLIVGPDGPRPPAPAAPEVGAAGGSFARRAQAIFNVPLPKWAELIDTTWYDLQDMGSLGHRVELAADGRLHVTWQEDFCELGGGCPPNLSAPQPHPNRGMGYAWRAAAGAWHKLGKVTDPRLPVCCIRDLAGGFGALAVPASGRVAIAQHLNEDGCDLRGYFHLEDEPGSNAFRGYLSPIVSPSYLFPQVAANPNGSFTVLGEVPRGGMYDETNEIRTAYLPAPGTPYTCFNWQLGPWTAIAPASLFRDGRPAFPCIASSANGRVGVAVGDLGGNVYLIESSNGTFAPGTITTRNLTNYSDATIVKGDSTSTEYRPYVHCHLAYNDTTPNVVWSEWQARKVGTTISYYDWRSRIRRWAPGRGAETVYQVPAGVADHFDDIDLGLSGPIPGFNTLSVDWPQVGFSPDGSETYVAFLRFTDAQVDPTADAGLPGVVTGIGFGDIFCSLARTGGFFPPQNLTNTPNTDERFFSLSTRNPLGMARVLFQASATNQAGCVIIGDRGTTPGNIMRRIAYMDIHLDASLLDVPPLAGGRVTSQLRVSPNPALAHARVHFETEPASLARRVEVLDLTGRRVAALPLPAGARSAEWAGRDLDGRAAPAGIYFARLGHDAFGYSPDSSPAARFVLAR